jgi:hypothetical protein
MTESLSRQHHIAGHLDRELICHDLENRHSCDMESKEEIWLILVA